MKFELELLSKILSDNIRPTDAELNHLVNMEWQHYILDEYSQESFLKEIPKMFLKFIDEDLLNKILSKNPLDYQYLENPTYIHKKLCLQKDARVLKYISSPNYEDYLIAIKSKFSEEIYESIPSVCLTDEMIYSGLDTNLKFFKKIPKNLLNREKVLLSIRKCLSKKPEQFELVPKEYVTPELVNDFLTDTKGEGLKYLDECDMTKENIILSIKLSEGISLRFVKEPDSEMRLLALSYHYDIFQLLNNPTEEEIQMYNEHRIKIQYTNELPRFLTRLNFSTI